jgi:hypothetical protein
VGNNELTTTKNVGELLAILIAMQMWQYNAERMKTSPWPTRTVVM